MITIPTTRITTFRERFISAPSIATCLASMCLHSGDPETRKAVDNELIGTTVTRHRISIFYRSIRRSIPVLSLTSFLPASNHFQPFFARFCLLCFHFLTSLNLVPDHSLFALNIERAGCAAQPRNPSPQHYQSISTREPGQEVSQILLGVFLTLLPIL